MDVSGKRQTSCQQLELFFRPEGDTLNLKLSTDFKQVELLTCQSACCFKGKGLVSAATAAAGNTGREEGKGYEFICNMEKQSRGTAGDEGKSGKLGKIGKCHKTGFGAASLFFSIY